MQVANQEFGINRRNKSRAEFYSYHLSLHEKSKLIFVSGAILDDIRQFYFYLAMVILL